MLLRSLNLRRLSYVLLSGEKNHFLTQLPSIQEKLVDTLRNVSAPVVQCEVYLCVRVLLCRLSPHNLSSFWPVILTELVRPMAPRYPPELTPLTFHSTACLIKSSQVFPPTARKSSRWCLRRVSCSTFCSSCRQKNSKCEHSSSPGPLHAITDTGVCSHQWIFITDTVDAIYRPENWFPEAMLDRLAEITGDLPVTEVSPLPPCDPDRPLIDLFAERRLAAARNDHNADGGEQADAAPHAAVAPSNRQYPRAGTLLLARKHRFVRERLQQWGQH